MPYHPKHNVAQGVGGEVPEGAPAPVDVLQDPLGVAPRPHPQILLEGVVPKLGELSHLCLTSDRLLLDLVPQGCVEVVGQLVGLDPDETLPDRIEVIVELFVVVPGKEREVLPEQWVDQTDELPAPADDVLPEPGLGLMDAVGGALSRRRVRELLVDSQVVYRWPALMYGGEEGRLAVHPFVPCGDPDVVVGD